MMLASSNYILLLLLIPGFDDTTMMLLGGACAFMLSYVFTFLVKALCYKVGWLDYPASHRVHRNVVPRLGGVAIFLAFLIASLLFYNPGPSLNPHAHEITIYWLLIAAGGLMVFVYAYDDVMGLKPWLKLLAQTLTVIIILAPWGKEFSGILLFTFNNPFGRDIVQPGAPWYLQPTFFLIVHDTTIQLAAIPAVLFTWFWIVGMMNTINLIDGLDGLAAGVVAIAALFSTIISFILQQYSIAILSALFVGAVLGFLPHNWNPAKIFMGDSGAMFLGLGLAVLSVIGGAKIALAFTVLGMPILDVAVVMINRIRRGQSPLHYDKTHLHYRLMATGLSTRQICYLFYGFTFMFGLLALGLPRIFKYVGILLLLLTMAALFYWIKYRQRKRGVQIKLGGHEPEPDGSYGATTEADDV